MAVRKFYLTIGNQAAGVRNFYKWALIIFFAALMAGILFFKWPWIVLLVLIPAAIKARMHTFVWDDYEYAADSYRKLTINTNDKYVQLDEQKLFFNHIQQIDVTYDKTDTMNEVLFFGVPLKALTKASLIFVLHDGNILTAHVQNRRVLLKIVDMLKPYTKTPDVDNLRTPFADAFWIFIICFLSAAIIFIIYSLISNSTR